MTGREGPVNPDNFVAVRRHLADGSVLDLGAGEAHPHADVTVDADPATCPDVCVTIEDQLPFYDDQFVNVTAIHFLEHLEADVAVWREMQRVAAERAIAVVPVGPRPDPDHAHVYDAAEALSRFQPDEYDVSNDPAGPWDYVLVANTG